MTCGRGRTLLVVLAFGLAATLASPEAVAARARGQVGIATYYAKSFEGRPTASGEIYRAEGMTAAHTDLPLGTRVRVTNLANHRSVVVTVNDRCRPRQTPFIDLSRAAARALGFLARGTARVRIEVLREPSPCFALLPSPASATAS